MKKYILFYSIIFILLNSINVFANESTTTEETTETENYIIVKDNYGLDSSIPKIKTVLTDDNTASLASNYIPSKFDLRNVDGKSYVTSLKSQGQYGTCYAFASAAVTESNLIMNNFYDDSIAVSPAQIAYYSNYRNGTEDKLKNTLNDISYKKDKSNYSWSGDISFALINYSNWIGPVSEKDWDYSNIDYDKALNKSKSLSPYNNDLAHLESSYTLNLKKQPNQIKSMLMKYGAGYICIEVSGSRNTVKLSDLESSLYNNPSEGTNHAVCLIGWDDNFPKESFIKSPGKDGAWLIKNSWGENQCSYFWVSYYSQEFNDLSEVTFMNFTSKNNYDNIYQYDGTSVSFTYSLRNNESFAHRYIAKNNETLNAIGLFLWSEKVNYSIQVYKNSSTKNPKDGILVSNFNGTTSYGGFQTIKFPKAIPVNKDESFSIIVTVASKYSDFVYTYVEAAKDFDNVNFYYDNKSQKPGQVFFKHVDESFYRDTYYKDTYYEPYSDKLTFRLKVYTKNNDKFNINYKKATCKNSGYYKCYNNKYSYSITLPKTNHVFNKKIINSYKLKSKCTIKSPAIYYYSCKYCNKTGTNTFKYGNKAIAISKLSIKNNIITLYKNNPKKANIIIKPSNATYKTLKYTSSNTKIFKVDKSGKLKYVKSGTTYLIVKSTDGTHKSIKIKVTCK